MITPNQLVYPAFIQQDDEIEIFDSFCKKNSDHPLLFTVKLRTEAEEKFNQFVEDVIVKRKKDETNPPSIINIQE